MDLILFWRENEMKRIIITLLCIILVFTLTGCGSSQTTSTQPAKTLTSEEFSELFSDAAGFNGSKVDFYAKVFSSTTVNGNPCLQAWTDIENSDKSIIIETDYKSPTEDEYIHVTGSVDGTVKGTNAFGAELSAPFITQSTVEKASYIEAVAPAIKTIEVNKEIDQYGLIVKVQKIELAKNETRVYFEITNNSQDNASFYSFNTKLIQGSTQFEEESNYEADYKQIQSELLPGVKSDGVIAFKAIDPANGDVKIVAEGSTDDYFKDFSPYQFDVSLK